MNTHTAIWIMAVAVAAAFAVGMPVFYGLIAMGASQGITLAVVAATSFAVSSLVAAGLAHRSLK